MINDRLRDYLSIHGIEQNVGVDFSRSKRLYDDQTHVTCQNLCSSVILLIVKKAFVTGSFTLRVLVCGPCLAFDGGSQFGSKEGFNDWKNGSSRVATSFGY
ncbi:hypothetical protein JTB14_000904 [Gonioctena quinquepunctata]|nr:hypothetical protein JTB14_000904 [Gonioctena quinquepunctata]